MKTKVPEIIVNAVLVPLASIIIGVFVDSTITILQYESHPDVDTPMFSILFLSLWITFTFLYCVFLALYYISYAIKFTRDLFWVRWTLLLFFMIIPTIWIVSYVSYNYQIKVVCALFYLSYFGLFLFINGLFALVKYLRNKDRKSILEYMVNMYYQSGKKGIVKLELYLIAGLLLLLVVALSPVVFGIVAGLLYVAGFVTGFSYNEVNIIVYYFFIPFSWLVLLDVIFHFHYLKVAFAVFCVSFLFYCKDFGVFADELFEQSVQFLNAFAVLGSNYVLSSVVICVIVPVIVYVVLIYFIIKPQIMHYRNARICRE
jgi:hypothetical protein